MLLVTSRHNVYYLQTHSHFSVFGYNFSFRAYIVLYYVVAYVIGEGGRSAPEGNLFPME